MRPALEGARRSSPYGIIAHMAKIRVHIVLKDKEIVIDCDDVTENALEVHCVEGGMVKARFERDLVKAFWPEKA